MAFEPQPKTYGPEESDEAINVLEAQTLPSPDVGPPPGEPAVVDAESLLGPTSYPPGTLERVLAQAASQIGYRQGANEASKFGSWYGVPNKLWCAMFVSWAYYTSGLPLPGKTSKGFSHCNDGRAWFKARERWTSTPARGHVVFYQWGDPAGDLDHVGIVERVLADGSIIAIEGNTPSPQPPRQPDGVFHVHRINPRTIAGYGIPPYVKAPAPRELPQLRSGSEGPAVRRLQGLLRAAEPQLTDAQLAIDGEFGARTLERVQVLQRRHGLDPTGVVAKAAWRALLGLPESS
jgi:peptidoglycan hydrolase-like protein with peptidoglycan-binding domain